MARRKKDLLSRTLGSMSRTTKRKGNNAATQAVYMALWGEEASGKYKKAGSRQ